uniref:Uncharacterized protein n=2 Tax=Anguilla anguilla TaxID=7936 RepID=A0A0E9UPX6_ANGAN
MVHLPPRTNDDLRQLVKFCPILKIWSCQFEYCMLVVLWDGVAYLSTQLITPIRPVT